MAVKRVVATTILLLLLIAIMAIVIITAGASGNKGSQPPTLTKEPTIVNTSNKHNVILRGTTLVPNVGETLFASNGTWTNSPTSFTYQWQRCNSAGAGCSAISGATNGAYVIKSADSGFTLEVIVTASNASGSASQTSTPTGVVQGTQVVSCFSSPGSCGYPDPNFSWGTASAWQSGGGGVGPTDGNGNSVPCSSLTSSGSITTSSNGQTITNLNIVGTLDVNNANVTITNICIASSGGVGGHGINMTPAASNLTINNSILSGVGPGNTTCTSIPSNPCNSVESPVSNTNGVGGLVMNHDYMFWCGECVHSSGTINDSYLISNGQQGTLDSMGHYQVDHYEDTYTCGGGITANHDTMFNPQQQTGDMFMDTNVCGSNIHFTATNSLFAGGGWELYAEDTAGETTAVINITNNRFSRCVTSSIFNSGSGGTTCSGGADNNGYFPLGGYYNLIYDCPSVGMTYSGNVWDNNNANAPC